MKILVCLSFALFGFTSPCSAVDPVININIELPAQLGEMLLQRTGTESIISVNGMVLKNFGAYDILAVDVSLRNWGDIKIGIKEGIMHATVAFVEDKKTGRVKLYAIHFPIQNFLAFEKINFDQDFTEMEATGEK